ncbi:AAA family ATPase [Paenibacillus tepidiphilus]|uniref:AAA family ATPase n=1 Tax=Paenibacillus tepidiphilus TaxID=2608683 RepID=UPI0012391357|nr:AAA family ATPase [Paenibacillus tepidiphilus]
MEKSWMELSKAFDEQYDHQALDGTIQLHKEFLARFPKESFADLSVEEYALGKTATGSLSWWLEYNTIPLGSIKGGVAAKHIIFYSKKYSSWKYPAGFSSLQEAWLKLRSDIVELMDWSNDEGFELSTDNLLHRANMVRGKLLFLYHPDDYLPIYQLDSLHTALAEFGYTSAEWVGKDNVACSRMLNQAVRAQEPFRNWHPVKIKDFLYDTVLRAEKFYKISPGKDAALWTDCRDGGYISIGWDDIGDLNEYADFEEFKSAFQTHYYQDSPSKVTEKANEVWLFYNMKAGDRIIANKGISSILAMGTVIEPGYRFRPELNDQKHTLTVKWDKVYDQPLEIPAQKYWAMKTVYELSKKQVLEWTNVTDQNKPVQRAAAEYTEEDERFFAKLEQALERKGQCILYGPPGTGKTFMARKYIEWKHEKAKIMNPNPGRPAKVWLMIASANFDFQWESILNNGGTVPWTLRSVKRNFLGAQQGDKILCYKGSGKDNGLVGFAQVTAPFDGEHLHVKGSIRFEQAIPYNDFKHTPEYLSTQAGKMNNRGSMFEVTEEFTEWVRDYLLENGDQKAAEWLDMPEQQNVELCTFHPSFNYEDFIEGYKPAPGENGSVAFRLEKGLLMRMCEKARENPKIPYFLIIDELNRGNVAKIFGETITLLEKDKRGVEVRLPQSKETFSIPGNLHLIATMNTSDRSIKMMDAALKRRFAFIECMPRYDLLKQEVDNIGISSGDILKSLNNSLVNTQGRDKQIGHAYFMKNGEPLTALADLKEVYELEIIPLIQEYCFDDYGLLAEIVGESFIDADHMEIRTSLFEQHEDVFGAELIKRFKAQ